MTAATVLTEVESSGDRLHVSLLQDVVDHLREPDRQERGGMERKISEHTNRWGKPERTPSGATVRVFCTYPETKGNGNTKIVFPPATGIGPR